MTTGTSGMRGYAELTGVVLPTVPMLDGLHGVLADSKAAALRPSQHRWYNVLARVRAYTAPANPGRRINAWESFWLIVTSVPGGYPPKIARGDIIAPWFLVDAHCILQTVAS